MVIEFIIALINLILSIKFIDNNGSIISQLIIFASALIFVIGSKFIYLTKLNKKKIKSNKNK